MYLNKDVAVRVAPTEINAVVAAVVMIVAVGIGNSISVNGISTICASCGMLALSLLEGLDPFLGASSPTSTPSIPGGGLRVLGGTTMGV